MYSAKARMFSAKARMFSAKTRIFNAKARMFSAKARMFSAKTRIFNAKARIFNAKARMFSAKTRKRINCLRADCKSARAGGAMGFLARLENGLFLFLAKTLRRKGFLLAGSKKKRGAMKKRDANCRVSFRIM